MRISYSKTKNSINYYVIDDYNRNGKRTTKIIEKIGNYNKVSELANKDNIDIDTWLNIYLNDYKEKHNNSTQLEKVIIEKYSNKLIPKDVINKFNIGYLFLKDIYYSLKINQIVKSITKKYKFEFDLNEVLSNLVFSRIIYPSSKLKTYELSQKFIETPKYNLENLYRGLTYLNNDLDYIQKELYNNSKTIVDRNTKIMYFDCTNYYFDINEETDFQKYGHGKDGKAKPLVGMGLFMDGHGLPIAMNLFPGNENETKHLIPLQEEISKEFNLEDKQTIICTDAAMCTDEIKQFNIKDGRAFVITQSIKKLKQTYKDEVFKDDNWHIVGDLKHVYKLNDILNDEYKSKEYYETIFYKIVQTETAHVVQDLIVTFQIKYRDYLRNVRDGQIQRAKNKIGSSKGEKLKLSNNQNDYRRLIKEEVKAINKDKNNKEDNSLNESKKNDKYIYSYSINEDIVKEEEKYDGYYGITTNLTGDISEILAISKNRWEIEESFRILKTDFDSGTIHLSREDRIKAHFLTCFISLLIYRILENKLNYKYTNNQIIEKLKEMEVYEEKGSGYSPAYVRNELTDDLHDLFGFRTDYEIVTYENFKKIFTQIKN
ncbi:MAG: IS1634 family transposase [Candidatus Onthovivens sp.]|nr:IS1634 family transposase [Candidatus Onthovivens sp.]